jgi:hypothetical protein
MSVYFVQRADGGPIKIGCTAFLDQRMAQLAVDTKAKLVLLASAPGSFRDEGRLHRQFAPHRVEGEWFADCADIRAAIGHIQRKGILPPPVEEDREVVMAARYLSGETLNAIGVDFGMTRERVRQILRATNIPSLGLRKDHRRQAAPVTDAEHEIAAAYAAGDVTPAALCERYDITAARLNIILRRTQTKRYGVRYWLTRADDAERTAKVVELYQAGLPSPQIAEVVGLSHQTAVYRYLAKAGMAPERLRRSASRPDTDSVVSLYRGGLTLDAIAARFGVSDKMIHGIVRRVGCLRTRKENEAIRVAAVRAANLRRKGASPSEPQVAA